MENKILKSFINILKSDLQYYKDRVSIANKYGLAPDCCDLKAIEILEWYIKTLKIKWD
jgi:hypothetical protein